MQIDTLSKKLIDRQNNKKINQLILKKHINRLNNMHNEGFKFIESFIQEQPGPQTEGQQKEILLGEEKARK